MHPRIEEIFIPSKEEIRKKLIDNHWHGWHELLSDDVEMNNLENNSAWAVKSYHVSGDFDVLIYADDLPKNWRQRDTIVLDLDKHGIFDILLYTGEELDNAINAANPVIMNVFDRPHKILYGKSFIDLKARFYNDEIAKCHILRLGNNTWKIAGGIDV